MTTPTRAIAVQTPGQAAVARAGEWTNREATLLGSAIARGLSSDDLRVFAAICRHTGLDPFSRQIYGWVEGGKLTIHISIGGWRGLAARTGTYGGQTQPEWRTKDGQWVDYWDSEEPPVAARVGVYIKGQSQPTYAVVNWSEFGAPKFNRKTKDGRVASPMWHEKPAHMLAIRAEYQALQKACPLAYEAATAALTEARVTVDVGDGTPTEVTEDGEIVHESPILPAVEDPTVGPEQAAIAETVSVAEVREALQDVGRNGITVGVEELPSLAEKLAAGAIEGVEAKPAFVPVTGAEITAMLKLTGTSATELKALLKAARCRDGVGGVNDWLLEHADNDLADLCQQAKSGPDLPYE